MRLLGAMDFCSLQLHEAEQLPSHSRLLQAASLQLFSVPSEPFQSPPVQPHGSLSGHCLGRDKNTPHLDLTSA